MGDKNIYKLKEFSDLMGVSTTELIRWDKNGVLVVDLNISRSNNLP